MIIRRSGRSYASLCGALALIASTANAQTVLAPRAVPNSNVPEGFHVARVILLGTGGGPRLRANRAQISAVLEVDGRPYLVDVGAGVVSRLTEAGIDTRFVQRVFITHNHTDHYNGILEFQSFVWSDRNQSNLDDPPVQVFGPRRTQFIVEKSLQTFSVAEQTHGSMPGTAPRMPASGMFTTTEITNDGVVYSDDLVKVTAVRNTHFDNYPRDSVAIISGDESYSYRFDTPAGSVVFTGDTGCSEAVEDLAEGADLLVSEVVTGAAPGAAPPRGNSVQAAPVQSRVCSGHLSSEEVGLLASRAKVGAVLLNHLVPGLDDEKDMSLYTIGALKHFKGPVIVGRDLSEYDLVKAASR